MGTAGAAGSAGAVGTGGAAGAAGVAGMAGVSGLTGGAGAGPTTGAGGMSSTSAGGYSGGPWSMATPAPCSAAGGSGPPVALAANTTLLLDGAPVAGARLYAGDLNGDGRPDLVVSAIANSHSSQYGTPVIAVAMNSGAGTFAAAVTYPLSHQAFALSAGDMDGDGDPDLVVAMDSGSVGVLLNRGDGTFAQAVDYPAGDYQPDAVVLSDVDGDHDLDVLVGMRTDHVVRIPNAGDGRLGAPTTEFTISDGIRVDPIAAADLDGDGRDDVIAISDAGLLIRASRTGKIRTVLTDDSIVDVAVRDLNGDGIPDLVATGSKSATILLNQGQLSFALAGTYPAATSVAIADVTGDGRDDVVTTGTDVTTVLVNDGDGSFHDAYPDGYAPLDGLMTASDLNGDGWIDLMGTSAVYPIGGVEIAINQGGGEFLPAMEGGPVGHAPSGLSLGDFDGDGDLDVAVVDGGDGSVTVLLNVGDGTFTPGVSQAVGDYLTGIAAGDLDSDGDLDLIVSGRPFLYVLLNDGTGVFSVTPYPGTSAFGSMTTGDINGDGALDVVLTAAEVIEPDTHIDGGIWVYLNAGNGTFTLTDQTTASVSSAGLADVNGDHALDLVTGSGSQDPSSFDVRLNDGHGNFASPTRYLHAGAAGPTRVADLNGDGKADVISGAAVALNDGSGAFLPPVSYGNGLSTTSALGDLDGDGHLDLVQVMGGLTVFTNNGCGEFTQGPSYAWSGETFAIGDMNGDGRGDLVVLHSAGVSVVRNSSP